MGLPKIFLLLLPCEVVPTPWAWWGQHPAGHTTVSPCPARGQPWHPREGVFGVRGRIWGLEAGQCLGSSSPVRRLGAKSRRVGPAAGCQFGFSAPVRAMGTLIACRDAAVGCQGAGLGGCWLRASPFPSVKWAQRPHSTSAPPGSASPHNHPIPRASVSPRTPQPIRPLWAWGTPQLALALIRTTGNTQRGGSEPHLGGGVDREPTAPLTPRVGVGARGQHGAPPNLSVAFLLLFLGPKTRRGGGARKAAAPALEELW